MSEGVQGEYRFSWTKIVVFSKKFYQRRARELVDKNRRIESLFVNQYPNGT